MKMIRVLTQADKKQTYRKCHWKNIQQQKNKRK
jgi:hypothetical protein